MSAPLEKTVRIGDAVEIETDAGELLSLTVTSEASTGTISFASPLGKALLGRQVGDKVTVRAPRGDWQARLVAIAG